MKELIKRALILALLAGCAHRSEVRSYYLYSEPKAARCGSAGCHRLDEYEALGYALVRTREKSWVEFVDSFYLLRDKLFPDAGETAEVREIRLYQRLLAEKLDRREIGESEWIYSLEKQLGELRARLKMSQGANQAAPICSTTKVGESFQTICY